MKVLKFGGSSVASPERIIKILDIIKENTSTDSGEIVFAVFSAFGGVTDFLLDLGNMARNGDETYIQKLEEFKKRHIDAASVLVANPQSKELHPLLESNFIELESLLKGVFLIKELSLRSQDLLVSFGERCSALIISYFFLANGIDAKFVDARSLIVTNDAFGAAKVDFKKTQAKIDSFLTKNENQVYTATGFIGSTTDGATTTLGRGGSDYTAAILAGAINASTLEIWTDVNGVLTSDPNKVPKAFTIPKLTYEEAMEMSHFGAKVIYPPTIQPILSKGIPLQIKNTFAPEHAGTLVTNSINGYDKSVKGISSIAHIALITIQGSGLIGVPGTAARVFSSLARKEINVILITQGSSEHSISFAVKEKDGYISKLCLEEEFSSELSNGLVDSIIMENSLSILAVVGEKMRFLPGLAGRLFSALGQNGINCSAIAQGSSERNISFVVDRKHETKALNVVHDAFFLSGVREINIFIIGVGLIGKTLLEQIKNQSKSLLEEKLLHINIIGLANSKKMILNKSGIDVSNWERSLSNSSQEMELERFIKEMINFNFPNTIFVDNTANYRVAHSYPTILESSISIATPNKIAFSSELDYYKNLKNIAAKRGVRLIYETNVGAGLPVLSTLEGLIASGDRLINIQGVLSGSLSFIFNSFKEGTIFSSLVRKAKQLGYTEPDPREDLSCFDIRRKLLILARDSGFDLNESDIEIEDFIPDSLFDNSPVEDFLVNLEAIDEQMEELRSIAASESCHLCVIGEINQEKATVSLKKVSRESPFFSLNGSDNMIVFTTSRYLQNPLVIRGPGAGSEVTAAGVFADILSIGLKQ